MTYADDYDTRLDDARQEFAGERQRRYCYECRQSFGHALGCPNEPPPDDDEQEQP